MVWSSVIILFLENQVLPKKRINSILHCAWFASVIFLQTIPGINAQLIVNLTSKVENYNTPVKYITYCVQCPDPSKEGSLVRGLRSRYGPQTYTVTGELIYCVPNHGEKRRLLNAHQLNERVVLVERGKVSILEKILRIQQQSHAAAIIIADDGSCDEPFYHCGSRAGSVGDGGFAAFDDMQLWSKVEIPVVLITHSSAEKLRSLMKIEKIMVRGSGLQNITLLDSMVEYPEL